MAPSTNKSEKKENPYKEVEVAKWVDEQVGTLRTFSSVGSEWNHASKVVRQQLSARKSE